MVRLNIVLLLVFSVWTGSVLSLPQDDSVAKGVRSDSVSIIFDSKRMIVNPGESLNLDCGVTGEYRYCHWEKGANHVLQVEDVHAGVLDGLRKPDNTNGNECGIVINSVTTEDHGTWTCKVYVVGSTLMSSKNVTVTIRPTQPLLEVSNRPLMVSEGDQETITCSVAAARPQVAINWYLGDEDITYNSKTENSLTDNMGTYKSISTLTQVFKAWNNGKTLRCSVAHYTLDMPVEDYVDISVRYKPWGKDIRVYDVALGRDVEATIDFSSNPSPLGVKWGYGPSFEQIDAVLPVPGEEGRYSTEVLALDEGHYAVILRVLEFIDEDAKMYFKITVENELGHRDFKVTISNDKPPNEPIASGIMAAIVVCIIIAILLVLCGVYMRFNHLYCFAKKKPAAESKAENGTNNSDTESARSADKPPKKSIFGKLQNGKKKDSPASKNSKPEAADGQQKPENGVTNEVVYAELSLAPGEQKGQVPQKPQEDTEYVHIVGVLNNEDKEKQQQQQQ